MRDYFEPQKARHEDRQMKISDADEAQKRHQRRAELADLQARHGEGHARSMILKCELQGHDSRTQTMTHDLAFRMALAAVLGLVAAAGNLLGGYFVVSARLAAADTCNIFWRWARGTCWRWRLSK